MNNSITLVQLDTQIKSDVSLPFYDGVHWLGEVSVDTCAAVSERSTSLIKVLGYTHTHTG